MHTYMYMYIHVNRQKNSQWFVNQCTHVMRDEKEERKKQARSNKAKQHSTPKAVTVCVQIHVYTLYCTGQPAADPGEEDGISHPGR